MAETATRVRWVWGYDAHGERITHAEAYAMVDCDRCGGLHPTRQAMRFGAAFPPQAITGRRLGELVGWVTSEFPPDD